MAAAAVVAAVFICALWLIPPWIQGPLSTEPTMRTADVTSLNGIRTALAAILVAVGAVGTLYINSLNQRTTHDAFRLATRGQLTDRYSRCVEQISSDSVEVRLGGIYGLEQFARESTLEADQALVVEILSSFVRRRTSIDRYDEGDKFESASPEIQAVLTVLGRLPYIDGARRADLRECVIHNAELQSADLRHARLAGAHFSESNLSRVDLRGADLFEAKFLHSNCAEAAISDANWQADYANATFYRSDLTGATLSNAQLVDSNFRGSTLSGADLSLSRLAGSDFTEANIAPISENNMGQLMHEGLHRARKATWGSTNFAGANLHDVKGLSWSAVARCIDERTLVNGELAAERDSTVEK